MSFFLSVSSTTWCQGLSMSVIVVVLLLLRGGGQAANLTALAIIPVIHSGYPEHSRRKWREIAAFIRSNRRHPPACDARGPAAISLIRLALAPTLLPAASTQEKAAIRGEDNDEEHVRAGARRLSGPAGKERRRQHPGR